LLKYLADSGNGRTKAGKRRFRLFGCACCRRIAGQLDANSLSAVEAVERSADGLLDKQELAKVEQKTLHRAWGAAPDTRKSRALWACHNAVRQGAPPKRAAAVVHLVSGVVAGGDRHEIRRAARVGRATPGLTALRAEEVAQCGLLRCIFGNPFRLSPPLPPAVLAWNDGTVRRLAEGAYDDRRLPEGTLDPGRLAILADALLDAGCADENLLTHLRRPGPHVRGCHALDFILGRA
jgi:hypothetical protein